VGLGNSPIVGEFLVFTKDLCPECAAGDIDFAWNGDGRWDIRIQAVQCPVGDTTIQYAFQGSNQWYIKLQVRNARIPITSLELKKGKDWVTPKHTLDGYWEVMNQGEWPAGPINVRMTAANGEVLNDVIPKIETDSTVIMDGFNKVQVSFDNSLPHFP
ncbi:expansin-YoaJ, partial [Aplysia californica]|uniref:Expansin-YoaJ n=1 Tax=Aplysia californica TaxID=6500 RepID=A0ABM1AB23_APLCA